MPVYATLRTLINPSLEEAVRLPEYQISPVSNPEQVDRVTKNIGKKYKKCTAANEEVRFMIFDVLRASNDGGLTETNILTLIEQQLSGKLRDLFAAQTEDKDLDFDRFLKSFLRARFKYL